MTPSAINSMRFIGCLTETVVLPNGTLGSTIACSHVHGGNEYYGVSGYHNVVMLGELNPLVKACNTTPTLSGIQKFFAGGGSEG